MSALPESEYPNLLMDTAKIFIYQCGAHVQLQSEADTLKICLQAPMIMQQFMGDVDIGKDPPGLLFYNSAIDFSIPDQEFRYSTRETGSWITVQIDFYLPSEGNGDRLLSRFLARVDSQRRPLVFKTDKKGRGDWSKSPIATAQAVSLRAEGRRRLYLRLTALRKYAFFETESSSPIEEQGGVFLFKDCGNLQDKVNDESVLATWTSDRIVFYVENHPETIIGQFIPHGPPLDMGEMKQPSKTLWKSIEDDE